MDASFSFEHLIELLTRTFAELEHQAMQQSELAELSMKQMIYLDTISKMDRPTFSDLAQRLGVSKPTVTVAVGKLIQKGYLEKVQSAQDKRSFSILLTEKGQALSALHANLHQKIARHFSAALSESELRQLAELLHKVLKTAF